MLPKPDSCKPCPLYGSGVGFVPDEHHEAALTLVLAQNPGSDEEVGRRVVGLDERGKPHYEPCHPRPMIGRTGYYMDTKFLPLADLERGQNVSVANVLKCRYGRSNDLPTGAVLKQAVKHCTEAHLRIPPQIKLIVAQGGLAWDWTQGQVGLPETRKLSISKSRGAGPFFCVARSVSSNTPADLPSTATELTGLPVLPVLHLADLFQDRRMELPSRSDWKKVPRLLAGAWPVPLPARLVVSSETPAGSISTWFQAAIQQAPWVAVDLEFVPESKFLTIVGLGYPAGETVEGIQLEWANGEIPSHLKGEFVRGMTSLLNTVPMIGWNVKDAELPVLQQNFHYSPPRYEDGMLLHACAWAELPHDLDFCCSVYSKYEKPSKKQIERIKCSLKSHIPLQAPSTLTAKSTLTGYPISLNTSEAKKGSTQVEQIATGGTVLPSKITNECLLVKEDVARSAVDSQRNNDSISTTTTKQSMSEDCFVSAVTTQSDGCGTTPGSLDEWQTTLQKKGWNFGLTKNWGDVCGTVECWQELLKTAKADPEVWRDYREQRLPLVPWLMETEARGLRVNKAFVVEAWQQYRLHIQEAQLIAEAYCGWPINLGSPAQLAHWLYDVESLPKQKYKGKVTCDDDAIAALREKQDSPPDFDTETEGLSLDWLQARLAAGAHPLLESRLVFAGARQCASHYLKPCLESGVGTPAQVSLSQVRTRIYPRTAIHTQANGRWSMTDPPMQQLPVKPLNLRNIVLPDEGGVWLHWDWKKAEPHLQMATMRSKFLESVLLKNWDLNTIYLCNLMGWELPPNLTDPHHASDCAAWRTTYNWGGSDDLRRRLAKTSALAMDYGKSDLSTVPGIYKLGLTKARLKHGGELMLQADPDKRRYIAGIRAKVKAGENTSRDWTGARRILLGSVGDARVREWLNHPFQRGTASLLNYSAVLLWQARESVARLDWTMHDAGWAWCPTHALAERYRATRRVVDRSIMVGGRPLTIPSSWSVIDDQGHEHTPEELGLHYEMDEQKTNGAGVVLDDHAQPRAACYTGIA